MAEKLPTSKESYYPPGKNDEPLYIHDELKRFCENQDNSTFTYSQLAEQLSGMCQSMTEPGAQLITDSERDGYDTEGQYGFIGMQMIARKIIGDSVFTNEDIDRMARSEIDANWALVADEGELRAAAELIVSARAIIAHDVFLANWQSNSDVD